MATQYSEEFKKDAVRYWEEHQELGVNTCARNLGISKFQKVPFPHGERNIK